MRKTTDHNALHELLDNTTTTKRNAYVAMRDLHHMCARIARNANYLSHFVIDPNGCTDARAEQYDDAARQLISEMASALRSVRRAHDLDSLDL